MTTANRMTVEEFERSNFEGFWELVDGALVEMPPSSGWASEVGLGIGARLWEHNRTNPLGRVYAANVGIVPFPDRQTVRAPDGAFVREERFPNGERLLGFLRLAPDLVLEVMSPDDRFPAMLAKVGEYLQAGVRLVWLVNPDHRSVTVFTPDAVPFALNEGDTLAGGDVLPGFAVPVAELFV